MHNIAIRQIENFLTRPPILSASEEEKQGTTLVLGIRRLRGLHTLV